MHPQRKSYLATWWPSVIIFAASQPAVFLLWIPERKKSCLTSDLCFQEESTGDRPGRRWWPGRWRWLRRCCRWPGTFLLCSHTARRTAWWCPEFPSLSSAWWCWCPGSQRHPTRSERPPSFPSAQPAVWTPTLCPQLSSLVLLLLSWLQIIAALITFQQQSNTSNTCLFRTLTLPWLILEMEKKAGLVSTETRHTCLTWKNKTGG